MKANFKINNDDDKPEKKELPTEEKKDVTDEEFENYIVKTGAAGSFMVFRNFKKKEDELGLDEI
tara:strand:+ start:315 stop:506 length:192 start_codon:yes stop_codon:yes gene_type:complete